MCTKVQKYSYCMYNCSSHFSSNNPKTLLQAVEAAALVLLLGVAAAAPSILGVAKPLTALVKFLQSQVVMAQH